MAWEVAMGAGVYEEAMVALEAERGEERVRGAGGGWEGGWEAWVTEGVGWGDVGMGAEGEAGVKEGGGEGAETEAEVREETARVAGRGGEEKEARAGQGAGEA